MRATSRVLTPSVLRSLAGRGGAAHHQHRVDLAAFERRGQRIGRDGDLLSARAGVVKVEHHIERAGVGLSARMGRENAHLAAPEVLNAAHA